MSLMNLTVTTESRYLRTPDGAVWTPTMPSYPFWARYLDVFDRVEVLARVREVPTAQPEWKRADGERVTFSALPYYVGPRQYALNYWRTRRIIRDRMGASEAVILRGGATGHLAYNYLRANKHPFGMEVVGDPYEVFAPGFAHPLRTLFRWLFVRDLRAQCRDACAAAYVNGEILQRRYPHTAGNFAAHVSDDELKDEAFVISDVDLRDYTWVVSPRRFGSSKTDTLMIITVGSLEQMYKGTDTLIDAIAKCLDWGLNVGLTVVGDGKYRAKL